ncbi:FAD-dependent oxidoreductase [Microbacterium sp. LMI12-1-1.1]|uniref:FAD-dependent oxidoreductase n=1 Tax=Microbacterium sp. LMI12-1-1.1 TaxID=3135225 RepID=UPI00343D4092
MTNSASVNTDSTVIRLQEDHDWDATADVVVVGTGVAGNTTAIHCADLGASVIMLEKADAPGGTSAKSGGGMMIPNNNYQRALGKVEAKEDFVAFLARVGRPLLFDPSSPTFGLPQWEYDLIETYFDNGADALARLEDLGALRVVHIPDWPSYNDVPQDKSSRGRYLTPADDGGRMSNGRNAIDRMAAKIAELGVEVRLAFRVDGLYLNDAGEAVGIRGRQGDSVVSIRALKAVVFASGGFTHNADLTAEYLNGQIVGGCAALTNTGDFIPIAKSLGVPLHQMNGAFFAPVVYEQAILKDPAMIANFNCAGDSVMVVNKYGVRVGNEKATYNDRTQSHFAWDPHRAEYPNVLQFVVMDKRCRDLYGYTGDNDFTAGNFIPRIGETSAYFLEGQTLEDLADRFAERLQRHAHLLNAIELGGHFVDNLRAAIDRFNGFARSGNDEDFARGQTGIEQWFMALDNELRADAAEAATESPNSSMAPLSDEGPYYGIILAPGTLDTKGGPKVNQKLQILDGDERAVPGLYGLGNCVASASGQAYWSAGCTWGPYLTFGYVAARNIIQEPVKGAGIAQAHVN